MIRKRDEIQKSASEHQHIDTLIGVHSSFTGELSFEGAVRVDGRFEGNVRSTKDGTLIISKGAEVSGEVNVPNLILHGLIKGNVHSCNTLKVGETGCIIGDVEYRVITLAEGGAVNGRCSRISEKEASAPQKATAPNEAIPAHA
ncbi:MAG: polymer-forming cytoskeletal protein [Mariprofundaceae bacterium]|nr:polymer-forming cytoskeletal protein [Mariprofundaceae bacterium]